MSAARAGAFIGPGFEVPRDEFVGPSALLALAVHAALAVALVVGVHWQSRAPSVIAVELWQPPPAPVARPEPPRVAPPPPPPPAAKPEPRIDKPDIAVKAPVKPKPKPEVKPAPKPAAKPAPKPDDTQAQRLLAEALQREQTTIAAERERQAVTQQLQREQMAARDRAMATWVDKIRTAIRQRIVEPSNVKGNPQAEVLVTLLPTGDVLDAKLVISSGHAGYDDAVLRAIKGASPLPLPDTAAVFERDLQLKFRLKD